MATFSKALDHVKRGGLAKRKIIKNDTVLASYKKRLYLVSRNTGVRYPYTPTNADLMSSDWNCIPNMLP